MRVLEKGRVKQPWSMEVVCKGDGRGCGARLLIELLDICVGVSRHVRGFPAFRCPECGHESLVEQGSTTIVKPIKYRSALYCEHANEGPRCYPCDCDYDCACREGNCPNIPAPCS